MPYQPIRVTAELGSPVVGDPTLPLDGILLYYAMLHEFGAPPALKPGETVDYDPALVPLRIVNNGSLDWFYACSFAQWSDYAEQRAHWNKRFDTADADYLHATKKIETRKAAYKSYHMPIYYRAARRVWWYCVGDTDRIARLLESCVAIGKKRDTGWGYVLAWHITATEHDYSLFDSDGQPMRAIPAIYYARGLRDAGIESFTIGVNTAMRGFRPPYWHTSNQGQVIAP